MMIRALEFYSGIGGLHRALEASSIPAVVVRSFDWDQTACQVYAHNYGPNIISKTDISTLSASDLIPFNAPLWLLSPSCQPYTVLNPDAKGDKDPRAQSFLHLINNVIPSLVQDGHAPKWILVENVAGFEASSTREILVKTLRENGYNFVELLLTPLQFGIPNSRLRYYILAKLQPLTFQNTEFGCDNRRMKSASDSIWRNIPGKGEPYIDTRDGISDMHPTVNEIRLYLENDNFVGDHPYRIPDRVLWKWGRLFDIVLPSSRRSCCFTRGYRQLVERSGSILQMNETLNTTEIFDIFLRAQAKRSGLENDEIALTLQILNPLRLRYFTPMELMALFCFVLPPGLYSQEISSSNESLEGKTSASDFRWPAYVSTKSKYRLIGNSVNVGVVKHLISYLFEGDDTYMQL